MGIIDGVESELAARHATRDVMAAQWRANGERISPALRETVDELVRRGIPTRVLDAHERSPLVGTSMVGWPMSSSSVPLRFAYFLTVDARMHTVDHGDDRPTIWNTADVGILFDKGGRARVMWEHEDGVSLDTWLRACVVGLIDRGGETATVR